MFELTQEVFDEYASSVLGHHRHVDDGASVRIGLQSDVKLFMAKLNSLYTGLRPYRHRNACRARFAKVDVSRRIVLPPCPIQLSGGQGA